jgi:hypothetical protein
VGFLSESLSPYPSIVCTHYVDVGPRRRALTVSPMGQTPIYDQVRGERINADVPTSGAGPHWADDHGKHRLLPETPVPAVVFGPPSLGDDFASHRHRRAWTYAAGWPAADGQRAASVWGPRAALLPEAHMRQASRHAASSPPASAAGRNPADRGTAAGDRGPHPEQGSGVRQVKRTEPQVAAPAGMQFSWFSAVPTPVCGGCYSPTVFGYPAA